MVGEKSSTGKDKWEFLQAYYSWKEFFDIKVSQKVATLIKMVHGRGVK